MRTRLLCPGPTPVPSFVNHAMEEVAGVYHRSPQFEEIFLDCSERLSRLIGTERQTLLLSSSGSGAMEAAVVNFTDVGDDVITINGGKFGERWSQLNQAYGCQTHEITLEWGQTIEPDVLKAKLTANPSVKAIFIQANETSTGVCHPIKDICSAIRDYFDGLIIVDAISSLGAHEMKMDAWGVDVVVSGSQKGFGVPPGLAYLSLSKRAADTLSERPRFYFDLRKEIAGQSKGRSAWTPATTLIAGTLRALIEMEKEGFAAAIGRHQNARRAVRGAFTAMGWQLVVEDRCASQSLTSAWVPEGIDGIQLLAALREKYGIWLAGGQDKWKGKIVRFAHLGFFDSLDLAAAMGAVESETGCSGGSAYLMNNL